MASAKYASIILVVFISIQFTMAMDNQSIDSDFNDLEILYRAKIWNLVRRTIEFDMGCARELEQVCREDSNLKKDILPAYFIQCTHDDSDKHLSQIYHPRLNQREIILSPGLDKKVTRINENFFTVSNVEDDRIIFKIYAQGLDFITWCPDNRFIASISNNRKKIQIWDASVNNIPFCSNLLQQTILFNKNIKSVCWYGSANYFCVFFTDGYFQHFRRIQSLAQKIIILIINQIGESKKNSGQYDMASNFHMLSYAFGSIISEITLLKSAWNQLGEDFGSVAQSFLISELNSKLERCELQK